MQKAIGAVLASVVLATSVITSASAASRYERQDRVIHNYCQSNYDNDCRDWDRDRDRWDEARYNRWYRDHHRDSFFGPDDAAAAVFGFAAGAAAGAITGSINGAANGSHVAAVRGSLPLLRPGDGHLSGQRRLSPPMRAVV